MAYLYVPPKSFYFTFKVDAMETLKLYCDDVDNVARRELESLDKRAQRYVGYCVDFVGPPHPARKLNAITLRPLQPTSTRPDKLDPLRVSPAMCAPVYPTSNHPASRGPLRTSKPLPWPNCYHPTCYDLDALVPTGSIDYGDAIKLELRSQGEMDAYVKQDAQCLDQPREEVFLPVLQFDTNLGAVHELKDPSDMYMECDILQRIISDCVSRQTANGERSKLPLRLVRNFRKHVRRASASVSGMNLSLANQW